MRITRSTARLNLDNQHTNLRVNVLGRIYDRENISDSDSTNSEEEKEEVVDQQAARMAPTITPMNIWAKKGLDLTDSTFGKIYEAATHFNETDDNGKPLKKFPLEDERFEEFRKLLTKRVNKMAMGKLVKLSQDGEDFKLLEQAPLVTEATMITHRDEIWDSSKDPTSTSTQEEVYAIQDQRIKCHTLGTWILDALSSTAITKLESSEPKYLIEKDDNTFVHGPFLYWLIVEDIKPNTDTLIDNAKIRLNSLQIVDFD